MIKVKIYTVGKTKELWLDQAVAEYQKRLSKTLQVEWVIVKDDKALESSLVKEQNYICFDKGGREFSSIELSKFLEQEGVKRGARLTFVIGGPEGIPSTICSRASYLLSLSKLTYTHQIVRLILMEQLYRSTQIQKGTKYHK